MKSVQQMYEDYISSQEKQMERISRELELIKKDIECVKEMLENIPYESDQER